MRVNRTSQNRTRTVCPPGLILPFADESKWNPDVRAALYFLALLYSFIGVSVVTDIFMGAVVNITSSTKKVYLSKTRVKQRKSSDSTTTSEANEGPEFIEVKVWNDTVANLTLMALGTSAPEILLACVELIGNNFESGDLGPGTIVGSAAFNLLVITALCIVSIPADEIRRVKLFSVFIVCSIFGVCAYIWLWVVVSFISPHVVELWEAILTFSMFPGMVLLAYIADKGWFRLKNIKITRGKRQFDIDRYCSDESDKKMFERQLLRNGEINPEALIGFMREIKKFPGLTDEDAAIIAASKIAEANAKSAVHYRISAIRTLTGGRKIRPQLSMKLKEVYMTLDRQPYIPDPDSTPYEGHIESYAVIEFQSATCAVKETIGSFFVHVRRHGNLKPIVKVKVESIDGSAKAQEDYIKVDHFVIFDSGETDKRVLVQIIDDKKWEPDEEFFLKLSMVAPLNHNIAQLGKISVMEITIIDKEKVGVISFEKRGILVKETADSVVINVRRKYGAEGEVKVKWCTMDITAISGRDFYGGEGELVFKHREILKTIEIPLINNLRPDRNERFEVLLLQASNNASFGSINRICVTITNDEAFSTIVDRITSLTSANLDALSACRHSWGDQIKDAVNVNGGDIENAKPIDYILHIVSFNWKVAFSLIPPPSVLGGWFCFLISLVGIGVVTTLISDIATTFGCVVGLKDATTAITLVAVGTSLPDTFASRTAAIRERHADTSIGNITGSNSFNVFLGLGLPWLIATIYHARHGTVFTVPSQSLGFTVVLFCLCALVAFSLLISRRYLAICGKAELGGPEFIRNISGITLFFLWILFVLTSCLQDYGYIPVEF